jgi:hypothetical protein
MNIVTRKDSNPSVPQVLGSFLEMLKGQKVVQKVSKFPVNKRPMATTKKMRGVHNRYTFDCGSSLAVVEDGQLPEELPSRHDGEELALPGHLHLPLLHDVDDAPHVPLLDDE